MENEEQVPQEEGAVPVTDKQQPTGIPTCDRGYTWDGTQCVKDPG